jgi:hypothetical protein
MLIIRRQAPQPRYNADTSEAFLLDILPDIPNCTHRIHQIAARNANEAVWEGASELGDVFIRENGLAGPVPSSEADLRHVGGIHEGDDLGWRAATRQELSVDMRLGEEAGDFGEVVSGVIDRVRPRVDDGEMHGRGGSTMMRGGLRNCVALSRQIEKSRFCCNLIIGSGFIRNSSSSQLLWNRDAVEDQLTCTACRGTLILAVQQIVDLGVI